MTQPVREPSDASAQAATDFRVRQLARRPGVPMRIAAIYHIKVVSDVQTVVAGDGKFIWAIEEDVDGMELAQVEIDVTTASSAGIVQVQLRNMDHSDVDMLSTRAQVDANETHSSTAAIQPVVEPVNAAVTHAQRLAIDVDQDGTGAKGLGLVAVFTAPVVP